jgi:hypothetical protein
MVSIVLPNKAANMLLPQHRMMQETKIHSWLPSNHCRSCRKTSTCSLLTNHKHTKIAYWICNTGRQGVKGQRCPHGILAQEKSGELIRNCHSESTTRAATSSRSLYTHGKGPRHILNRNVTQHYSHSEITVGGTLLSDGPRIYKKSRSHLQILGNRKVT